MKYEITYDIDYIGRDNSMVIEADDFYKEDGYLYFTKSDKTLVAIIKKWNTVVKIEENN